MQIAARVRRTCYVGQVARVEIAWNSSCGEGRDKLFAQDRIHASSIYIYMVIGFFSPFFFLIRREIGQIKIRSEVRVALEFTRFLVTRGSSVLTRDRIIFSSFSRRWKIFLIRLFPVEL